MGFLTLWVYSVLRGVCWVSLPTGHYLHVGIVCRRGEKCTLIVIFVKSVLVGEGVGGCCVFGGECGGRRYLKLFYFLADVFHVVDICKYSASCVCCVCDVSQC